MNEFGGAFRAACSLLIRSISIGSLLMLSVLSVNRPTPVAAAQPGTAPPLFPQNANDPYGDSASYAGLCLGIANNAVGAPDGSFAGITGLLCGLTVNFDADQNRTGNIVIYTQNLLSLSLLSSIDIMSGTEVLQSIPNAVDLSLIGAQTTTILYTGTQAYTGIRFGALVGVTYAVGRRRSAARSAIACRCLCRCGAG